MRNSDPDAAVYWLARMVEAGEDPLYIARRLVRFASEDIGNADPQALDRRGRGQGRGPLHRHARRQHRAGAGRDLPGDRAQEQRGLRGLQPRGRATRTATSPQPVPLHLRNAPTRLMKELDYGKGYQYAHDEADAVADMSCLPPALAGTPLLRADRARLREGDQAAAGRLGGDQEAAPNERVNSASSAARPLSCSVRVPVPVKCAMA